MDGKREGERLDSKEQIDRYRPVERAGYLTDQLLTYLGNKRALLDFIGPVVDRVKEKLGKDRLRILDLFSGSGVTARYFKRHAERLIVNDLEAYCEVINRCYLANESSLDLAALRRRHRAILDRLEDGPLEEGIITRHYAPADDEDIRPGERVFYTNRNARYLDTARRLMEEIPEEERVFFLAPLLSEASVHANTSGVFKGFHKNARTGIGQFGGTNADALSRIRGPITLPFPVFSAFEGGIEVHREDANALVRRLPPVDLAYLDPPYNQHPYGSNYFMLNLLVSYREPDRPSRVSGIPEGWTRSDYNRRRKALVAFSDCIRNLDARFILVSFNSEGFLRREEMTELLSTVGSVELLETQYNTFRGSRNLRNRSIHVREYLYLVERSG